MGVSPESYQEAKAHKAENGVGRYGCGVDASLASMPLDSRSADNGAVRSPPSVGGRNLLLGVLTGKDILSRTYWQARCANGLPEGDATESASKAG